MRKTIFFRDLVEAHLSLAGFSNILSLNISLRGFGLNVFAQLAGPVITMFLFLALPWISKSLVLTGTCQFHWAEELPWHTVVTDQNNLQHSLKWKVSSLDLFKILCLLLIFLSVTPFANFGNKFTRYFFISFEYNLSDVHLGSSSLLFSNGKDLGVASEIPFSNEL